MLAQAAGQLVGVARRDLDALQAEAAHVRAGRQKVGQRAHRTGVDIGVRVQKMHIIEPRILQNMFFDNGIVDIPVCISKHWLVTFVVNPGLALQRRDRHHHVSVDDSVSCILVPNSLKTLKNQKAKLFVVG